MADTEKHARPFAAFLQEFNDGESHEELSEALVDLVAAVQAAGKQGTITFTLKVSPAGRNAGATVMITDKIVVKSPEPGRAETIWFVDRTGNLTRRNPDQETLPLRGLPGVPDDVDLETGEVRA